MGYRPQGVHVVGAPSVVLVYEALSQQHHRLAARLDHLHWSCQLTGFLGRER